VVPYSGYSSTESNWNLEALIFAEGGKLGVMSGEKPSREAREARERPTNNSTHA
jgi:hypothetical protein